MATSAMLLPAEAPPITASLMPDSLRGEFPVCVDCRQPRLRSLRARTVAGLSVPIHACMHVRSCARVHIQRGIAACFLRCADGGSTHTESAA
jgi:hypothetical protein